MERKYIFLIVFSIACVVSIILYFTIESFQRMNYLQMHNYLDYKHGNGVMRHGFPDNKNTYFGYNQGIRKGPISVNTRNDPKLVGYLYSQDEENNDTFQLYEMHDYKRGRPGYVYKDSKYEDNRNAILVVIPPEQYNGDTLFDGDVVNIQYNNRPFVVKLYEIKNYGFGTRYESKDFRDEMESYGLLTPVDAGDGEIDKDDQYFILYRQELDSRKDRYNYYIKDKGGSIIELDDYKYEYLSNGDTLSIPGKERYGLYSLELYDTGYYW